MHYLPFIFATLITTIKCQIWKIYSLPLDSPHAPWSVVSDHAGNLSGKKISAVVPGNIYSDLKDNSFIGDPYVYGIQEKLKFIALANWTYQTQFAIPDDVLKSGNLDLTLHGVDTICEIFLNNQLIGKTDNMFVKYQFSISSYVERENILVFNFTSPIYYSNTASSSSPYPVPPACPPDIQHGFCHVNFIRKEQASYSWDWGPAFPTTGIWKSLYISSQSVSTIENFSPEITSNGEIWEVTSRVFIKQSLGQAARISVVLEGTGLNYTSNIKQLSTEHNITIQIDKQAVELWWPNGVGEQNLYNITIILSTSDYQDKKTKIIGFREIKLIQRPLVQGLSFYFTVNDKPIFMKGSNWIPADSFQRNVTTERLNDLLYSAKLANMNMLRVWGGGIYEQDEFYDLADRYGILIWQDLMFACAMYPTDTQFLNSVKQEVKHQVHKLKHHPSIAVWAGNNENEAALRQNWYGTKSNFSLYHKDYVKLYVTTLRNVVQSQYPSSIYVTSSPSNGKESEQEGYVAENPYSTIYGDVHYYNYTAGRWYADDHPASRFLSEYGMMSWSYSVFDISTSKDWFEFSKFAFNRNHHGMGQYQLNDQIRFYFNQPNSTEKYLAVNFTHYIYLTQITQAMYIKEVTAFSRRLQNYQTLTGGLTMGALYWQLNDIWQTVSWSSIDYVGDWKMLHYYMKKIFSRTALSLAVEDNSVSAYIMIDEDKPSTPAPNYIRLECRDYNQFDATGVFNFQIKTWNQSTVSEKITLNKLDFILKELSCNTTDHYLKLTWGEYSDYRFYNGFKNTRFNQPKLKIRVENSVKGSQFYHYSVTLTIDHPAMFVWLKTSVGGHFSDNGFHMEQKTLSLTYYNRKQYEVHSLEKDIEVLTLADLYTY